MKKISLFLVCCTCSILMFGQKNEVQKEKKKPQFTAPVLFKDRIVLDFFSSTWMGLNTAIVKQKAINFGFNGAIMFDLSVTKKSPFSFGLGLGVTNHNLYSNAIWGIGENYTTIATSLPDGINYRKNKITFTNVNIPFEFRYRHHSGFKISAGVRIGLMADIHSKYFGVALDGSADKTLIKDYKIPNRTKIPVEFTFKTGWKFVSIYASYMITKMFEAEKGPRIYPISIGVTLCPY